MNVTTKEIALTGIVTALYVALSIFVNIPLADKISLDMGYVILGIVCAFFAPWQCAFIAGVGCFFKATLQFGMIPTSWFPANLLLGVLVAYIGRRRNFFFQIILTVIATFICIAGIKTALAAFVFGNGTFAALLPSNIIASIADSICIVIGLAIGKIPAIKKLFIENTGA